MEQKENIELKKQEGIAWYAIRVTYSREMIFKEYLDGHNVENFIPMHYESTDLGAKKSRKLVPIIHNLVFVHSTKGSIDTFKSELEVRLPIRYIMDKATGRPIIIPDKQMQDFIAVSGTYDDQLVYLDPVSVILKKGDKVRITGGIFSGVEGVFVRVKGDRRVVVSIQGIMAVATAFIHPSLIEKIE